MVGNITRWFHDNGITSDERRGGHARHDGEWEIPRRNDDADAQGQVDHLVFFAGHLNHGIGVSEALHLAGVVFGEVDRFADIGIGFGPGLAGLIYQPGIELELALAYDGGGAEQHRDPLMGRRGAPFREEGIGILDGASGELGGGLVVNADQLARPRRIQRFQKIAGLKMFAGDLNVVFTPELAAHLGECLFHRFAVGGLREIGDGFVCEGRKCFRPRRGIGKHPMDMCLRF